MTPTLSIGASRPPRGPISSGRYPQPTGLSQAVATGEAEHFRPSAH